jgi:hypothetical protein
VPLRAEEPEAEQVLRRVLGGVARVAPRISLQGAAVRAGDLDLVPALGELPVPQERCITVGASPPASSASAWAIQFANTTLKCAVPSPTQRRVWSAAEPARRRADGTQEGGERAQGHPSWWPRPPAQLRCPCDGGGSTAERIDARGAPWPAFEFPTRLQAAGRRLAAHQLNFSERPHESSWA